MEIRDDFLGSRNVQASAGEHEIDLRINIPEKHSPLLYLALPGLHFIAL